jgi:hypothetical protein
MDEPWKHYFKKPAKKTTYYLISLMWNIQNREIRKQKNRLVVVLSEAGGNGGDG